MVEMREELVSLGEACTEAQLAILEGQPSRAIRLIGDIEVRLLRLEWANNPANTATSHLTV